MSIKRFHITYGCTKFKTISNNFSRFRRKLNLIVSIISEDERMTVFAIEEEGEKRREEEMLFDYTKQKALMIVTRMIEMLQSNFIAKILKRNFDC